MDHYNGIVQGNNDKKDKASSLPFPLQNGGGWGAYFEPFYGNWWPYLNGVGHTIL